MKISLITVCYNSERTIKETIESVLCQSYTDYEYIIVDGKSSDGTMNIVKSYEKKFNGKIKYISEKDNGLYDAMNKGINMATGDVIGILNSDDTLANSEVFKKISLEFLNPTCDGTYSDLYIMDNETMKKIERVFISKRGNYKFGWYPPHPTLYLKKNIYEKYGNYNQKYSIAADYDFMIRIMKQKVNLTYIPEVLIFMRSGGKSTAGFKGYWKSFKQSLCVLKDNKVRFSYFVNILRTINIFNQALKSKLYKLRGKNEIN